MLELSIRYTFLVFGAVTGVLQAAAAYGGVPGLSYIKDKFNSYMFAAITTGSSLYAFFTWNYWCATGVIEGSQQFGLFILGTALALTFTISVAALARGGTFSKRALTVETRKDFKNMIDAWGAWPKNGKKRHE